MDKKPRMTLAEVLGEMRERGMSIGQGALTAGIENGAFPFGRVMSTGKTGRRQFLILRKDFETWAEQYL
mgnify:CR=1 FL=1